MSTPRVYTYHCAYCSHLVLATTHGLDTLPHRREPALDKAIILPLPPPPKSENSSTDDEASPEPEPRPSSTAGGEHTGASRDKDSYTVLLALTRDRTPKIITRDDGFEKRYLYRCGRCKLHVGYQLDEIHYELGPKSDTHSMGTVLVGGGDAGAEKDRASKEKEREGRGRYLYILPGALLGTEELGREVGRHEVELVEGAE